MCLAPLLSDPCHKTRTPVGANAEHMRPHDLIIPYLHTCLRPDLEHQERQIVAHASSGHRSCEWSTYALPCVYYPARIVAAAADQRRDLARALGRAIGTRGWAQAALGPAFGVVFGPPGAPRCPLAAACGALARAQAADEHCGTPGRAWARDGVVAALRACGIVVRTPERACCRGRRWPPVDRFLDPPARPWARFGTPRVPRVRGGPRRMAPADLPPEALAPDARPGVAPLERRGIPRGGLVRTACPLGLWPLPPEAAVTCTWSSATSCAEHGQPQAGNGCPGWGGRMAGIPLQLGLRRVVRVAAPTASPCAL